MSDAVPAGASCLICCPLPYGGRGWPQTCVEVVKGFRESRLDPVLVTPRIRKPLPSAIGAVQSLSFSCSFLPWKIVRSHASATLNDRFERLLREADPKRTIAYFWPGSSPHLVEVAKRAGIITVREMINTYQGTAKRILDHAYDRWNLPRGHSITERAVSDERQELHLYDHVFAPSLPVKESLIEAGIPESRIILSSYGWSPERFAREKAYSNDATRPFRALFVGLVCVRKGVPELLEAWNRSGVNGELLLVGDVEPALQNRLDEAVATGTVRHMAFTQNLADHYRDADLFVFPSLEEGCPQVTLEAAGCGLPVLATPMGAANVVRDGVNGIVVPEGNVDALSDALARLAADSTRRQAFSAKIAEDAQRFTYARVSVERAKILVNLLSPSTFFRPSFSGAQPVPA